MKEGGGDGIGSREMLYVDLYHGVPCKSEGVMSR